MKLNYVSLIQIQRQTTELAKDPLGDLILYIYLAVSISVRSLCVSEVVRSGLGVWEIEKAVSMTTSSGLGSDGMKQEDEKTRRCEVEGERTFFYQPNHKSRID